MSHICYLFNEEINLVINLIIYINLQKDENIQLLQIF